MQVYISHENTSISKAVFFKCKIIFNRRLKQINSCCCERGDENQ